MTSARRKTTSPRRRPLTRSRVLEAAIQMADDEGIDAVTMRRLGEELGVQAMSLYNHVRNKADIESGIVDAVMDEIEDALDEGDWKHAVRRSAVSAHTVLMRHPWACSLVMRTTTPSPGRLRWMEALLRTLREAGFSPELADHAYHALDSHITGFTLWQANLPFTSAEEMKALATDFLDLAEAGDHPYVVEHVHQHLSGKSATTQAEFEFGLDLILDGLERLRDAPAKPAAHRRSRRRRANAPDGTG